MDHSKIGTLAHEFPDFPAGDLPPDVPAWLAPAHWHNDSCPGFRAEIGRTQICLYVDYVDVSKRELLEDGARFYVLVGDLDHSPDCVLQSDDWDVVKLCLIAHRWIARFERGFNPDTRGKDYVYKGGKRCLSDVEAAEYESDMDVLWKFAADPYQTGLDAMKARGLI